MGHINPPHSARSPVDTHPPPTRTHTSTHTHPIMMIGVQRGQTSRRRAPLERINPRTKPSHSLPPPPFHSLHHTHTHHTHTGKHDSTSVAGTLGRGAAAAAAALVPRRRQGGKRRPQVEKRQWPQAASAPSLLQQRVPLHHAMAPARPLGQGRKRRGGRRGGRGGHLPPRSVEDLSASVWALWAGGVWEQQCLVGWVGRGVKVGGGFFLFHLDHYPSRPGRVHAHQVEGRHSLLSPPPPLSRVASPYAIQSSSTHPPTYHTSCSPPLPPPVPSTSPYAIQSSSSTHPPTYHISVPLTTASSTRRTVSRTPWARPPL